MGSGGSQREEGDALGKVAREATTHVGRHRFFFWALVVLTVLTAALFLWRWWEGRGQVAGQSRPVLRTSLSVAPDFRLEATEGNAVRLEELRGRVVLVNFWATWCPPCKAEMPDLEALYREYGVKEQFVVLGINLEEDREAVEAFAQRLGLSFPLLLDSDGEVTSRRYAVRSLPTTFIIDREGRIRDVWNGQLSRRAMLERLRQVW